MTLWNRREASPGPAGQLRLPGWVLDALRCPVSGAELELSDDPQGVELAAAEGVDPRLAYLVRDGIPALLEHEARQIDWRLSAVSDCIDTPQLDASAFWDPRSPTSVGICENHP